MRWSDVPFNAPPKMLRQFAGLWILFFGGAAVWRWLVLQEPQAAAVLAALALTVGLLGLVAPAVIRPIWVAWLAVAFPIGWVVSRVALVLLFFCVITPVALVFRLRGRDLLQLRRQSGRQTYWTPKPTASGLSSYFRQY